MKDTIITISAENKQVARNVVVLATICALIIAGLNWVGKRRPDYRIVSRYEVDFTRYVIERRIFGSFYCKDYDFTYFTLKEAKEAMDKLEEKDAKNKEIAQEYWVVETPCKK